MKRTVQVNVKMTDEDLALLKRAADKRWPDAVLTHSGIVLGFAKLAATQTLGVEESKMPKKSRTHSRERN